MSQLFHNGIILGEGSRAVQTVGTSQFQGKAHIRQGEAETVPAAENRSGGGKGVAFLQLGIFYHGST